MCDNQLRLSLFCISISSYSHTAVSWRWKKINKKKNLLWILLNLVMTTLLSIIYIVFFIVDDSGVKWDIFCWVMFFNGASWPVWQSGFFNIFFTIVMWAKLTSILCSVTSRKIFFQLTSKIFGQFFIKRYPGQF